MGSEEQGIQPSRHRYQVIPRTLIFIRHEQHLLLLKGAPDKKIWPNLYNGIGGHIEPGESIPTAALREIQEETGLYTVQDLRLRCIIHIDAQDPLLGIVLFVFTAVSPTREVISSKEGRLEWVKWEALPPASLVPDLSLLLPHLHSMPDDAPPCFGRYWYDEQNVLQISLSS